MKRDAALLISWVRQLGGVAVADTSSRGGIHVYVPLADNESLRCESLKPLYAQLTKLLPTLDKGPMDHPVQGCITRPAAAAPKEGSGRWST
ncbi:hypothetical protein [Nocardia sp. IFM 10818]